MCAGSPTDVVNSPQVGPSSGTRWRSALHRSFAAEWEILAAHCPDGKVERHQGMTVVRTGLPSAFFNRAFALDPPKDAGGAIDRIRLVMDPGEIPWSLVTTTESLPGWNRMISTFQLKLLETVPGMAWDVTRAPTPAYPRELEIHAISEPDEARTFWRIDAEGTGLPPGFWAPLAERLATEGADAWHALTMYLGIVGGRPVCITMRIDSDGIGGIYAVVTLPEFRRKGYGAAITAAAAFDGKKAGSTLSYLQSSEMGRPVYEGLGYRLVEEYQFWIPGRFLPKDSPPSGEPPRATPP